MTGKRPPRLALALLDRFAPDGSYLAGDLVEEFMRRPSRAWFWWQVLGIAASRLRQFDDIRPLHLVDLQPVDAQERTRRFGLRFHPVNLTASPIPGIGGLGLASLVLLVSVLLPAAWLFLVASIVAGVTLGILMIAAHHEHRSLLK